MALAGIFKVVDDYKKDHPVAVASWILGDWKPHRLMESVYSVLHCRHVIVFIGAAVVWFVEM